MDHEIGEEKRHLENQGIPFRKDKIMKRWNPWTYSRLPKDES